MAKDDETKPIDRADRLAGLSLAAGRALLIERAWPPLVAAIAVAILFLAVSWLGAWLFAPRALRVAGVVLFALGLLVALAPLLRLRWPAARDIAARLDRDSGMAHRPATSLSDTLANDHDPMTRALWAAHQAQLSRTIEATQVAPPAPRMVERDPYALRFGVAMMAFAAAVAAGPELYGRLAAAFDWRGGDAALAAAGSRIDAWIDPPPYAGRPPVVIDVASGAPQTLTAFEDSVLVVRGEPGVVATKVEGAIAPVETAAKTPPEKAPVERRWTIRGDGKATIWRGGSKAADVAFSVTPAGAPTITLTGEPQANLSGSLSLAYKIEDRYGVTGARAQFAAPHDPSKPAPRSLGPAARSRTRDADRPQRIRRGARHHRPLGAPVGRGHGHDDAERDQRLGQNRAERPGRSDLAAASVPQSARPCAGRRAARPHSRSRPCSQAH